MSDMKENNKDSDSEILPSEQDNLKQSVSYR